MSNPQNLLSSYDALVLDPTKLSRNSVNAVRVTFGVLGLVGIALGIVMFV